MMIPVGLDVILYRHFNELRIRCGQWRFEYEVVYWNGWKANSDEIFHLVR